MGEGVCDISEPSTELRGDCISASEVSDDNGDVGDDGCADRGRIPGTDTERFTWALASAATCPARRTEPERILTGEEQGKEEEVLWEVSDPRRLLASMLRTPRRKSDFDSSPAWLPR